MLEASGLFAPRVHAVQSFSIRNPEAIRGFKTSFSMLCLKDAKLPPTACEDWNVELDKQN